MNCKWCGRFMSQVKPWEDEYDPVEVVTLCEYCGDYYAVDEKATKKNWEEIDKLRKEG